MRSSVWAWVVTAGALVVAIIAVMMLRFAPVGTNGDDGVLIIDRLTGEVCLTGASGESMVAGSICIRRGEIKKIGSS